MIIVSLRHAPVHQQLAYCKNQFDSPQKRRVFTLDSLINRIIISPTQIAAEMLCLTHQ